MIVPARLAELQTWMLEMVAAREAAQALPIDRVLPSSNQSAAERLAIYRHGYLARLLACLRESFPVLAAALGKEAFDSFADEYVQRFPPNSYTLNDLADNFADHLAATRPGDVPFPGWPDFLIELARLEHAIEQTFDGPGLEGMPPLQVSDLASQSPDALQTLRLEPAPCLRLLDIRFPLDDYYTAVKRGESPAWPQPTDSYLAITRCDYVVRRVPLEPAEFRLLAGLVSGQTLGDSLRNSGEISPAQLAEWFAAWGRLRFFCRAET